MMAYEPTVWKSGDLVTATKLNKMEQGIAGSGGGVLCVRDDTNGTLNKTFGEIVTALENGTFVYIKADGFLTYINSWFTSTCQLDCFSVDNGNIYKVTYQSTSADDYPTILEEGDPDS